MRILIISIGSAGDLNPYIAVGRELRSRGHEVAVLANPHFERRIAASDLAFLPLGEREEFEKSLRDPRVMHPVLGPIAVFGMLRDAAPRVYEATRSALVGFRPDLVFRHMISSGARWAVERAGVPCATGALSPIVWDSVEERVPPGRSLRSLRLLPHRLIRRLRREAIRQILDRPFARIARSLGLPRERNFLAAEWYSGVAHLGLWSPAFRGPAADDPPGARIVGFPFYDEGHDSEGGMEDVERFLDAGDPPVIFSLGTTAVHHAGGFYGVAAKTCRLLRRRGLLLVGSGAPMPDGLPEGVAAFRYAPFSRVLPRGAATVHHGGVGTTAQALRAGRPMVVVPFSHDQPDNARRAVALGVARTLRRSRVTPERLARLLETVLTPAAVLSEAERLGIVIRSENGASVAADALLAAV